jgi:hypothetical protein
MRAKMPLNLSLNTSRIFTPISSAAVTGVPFGSVRALEVPFRVRVTGRVAVVPVGMTSSIKIVRWPTGWILRKPRAISIVSVPIVTLVELR